MITKAKLTEMRKDYPLLIDEIIYLRKQLLESYLNKDDAIHGGSVWCFYCKQHPFDEHKPDCIMLDIFEDEKIEVNT